VKVEHSRLIVFVSLLAALDIILSTVPIYQYGPSIAAIMKPFDGVMLGPLGGAMAALLGGVIATFIWPGSAALLYVTWIPGLVGAIGAGMLFTRRWYVSFALFGLVILGFLLHPWGSSVFIYACWDKVIALASIMPASRIVGRTLKDHTNLSWLSWSVGLVSFISTEMDAATGNLIFLFLAQVGLYGPMTPEVLPSLFLPYVLVDPAALILAPVLYISEKANILKWPLT